MHKWSIKNVLADAQTMHIVGECENRKFTGTLEDLQATR